MQNAHGFSQKMSAQSVQLFGKLLINWLNEYLICLLIELCDWLIHWLTDWLIQVVLDRVVQKFQEKDDYLMRLEKQINPLLDDDDLTALTYIFSEIMEKNIKTLQVRIILKGGFAETEMLIEFDINRYYVYLN